jgi:signal transduction histidine kinase
MEGWGWQSVHDPGTLPAVIEQWQQSITSGEPFEMIFPLKGADGKFRQFLTRVIPIRDNEGNIYRWFGTNTDITKQKELERMKDDFLGMASHELKTPVTVIKAYAQMLEEFFKSKGDIEAAGRCEKMHIQVNKLTGLIEDLLDVTKIQSGKMNFHNTYFDFNELVKEVIDQLSGIAPDHNIEVHFSKTKMVYADRKRMRQVVTNFITNALKYSPHSDKIIVHVKSAKANVTLSVQDFGMGISKDNQDKVFEKFYRVTGNHQNTFPGLGLGLYISSEIIKSIGGKIWVESEEAKGSVFYFTIPTVEDKKVE